MKKENKTNDKILLIAGNGDLPRVVVEELKKQKKQFDIFCFIENQQTNNKHLKDKNHINNNYEYFVKSGYKPTKIYLSNIADIITKTKQSKAKSVICCGGIKFNGLASLKLFNTKVIKYGLKAFLSKSKGDNFLLNIAGQIIKDCGCKLIGVQDILPNLICSKKDAINATKCKKQNNQDIQLGFEILKDISKYDIGQSIIIQNGRVLAMEGVEGTDELLRRSKNYKIKSKTKPVLIKSVKIGQNKKLDLPTIGIETFKRIVENNFAGIAVSAGSTILLDKEEIRQFCKKNNIFLQIIELN